MSCVVSHSRSVFLSGDLFLCHPAELRPQLESAENAGLLVIELPPQAPAARGQLAVGIESAIETALLRRGACPSGTSAAASISDCLADQLYRARLLEFCGLALVIPSLSGISDRANALDPDDSAVLRFLLEATRTSPLRLLIDDENESLGVYGPPLALAQLISGLSSMPSSRTLERKPISERHELVPAVAPEVAASSAAMELSEPPPAVVERDGALAFEQSDEDEGEGEPGEPGEAGPTSSAPELERAPTGETDDSGAAPSRDGLERRLSVSNTDAKACRESAPSQIGDITDAIVRSLVEGDSDLIEPQRTATAATPRGDTTAKGEDSSEPTSRIAPRTAILVPPLYPNANSEWRGWLSDLQAARGPRPLSVIERMFVTSYVPLRNAAMHGIGDEQARRALDAWSGSFAQSYRDAFDALRVRGKRPSMVLDVPELALRIGRLHGARSTQLMLVDGMRFDLGLRIDQRVRALVGQQAVLAERLLLWAALPSSTEAQLDLIGRGPEGLRDTTLRAEAEIPVARGRAASTFRRVKAGHREVLKLDLIEARLSEPGPPEAERLDRLADETAPILAEHLVKQTPRTLVLVFADHGFLLPQLENATAAGESGGATPEEVLVPAFAWLVGGVH